MEEVRQLLVASDVVNRMKKEIDVTGSIVMGFLTKEDLSRFKYAEEVCGFSSGGLHWKVTKWKREMIDVVVEDAVIYTNYSHGQNASGIPLKQVKLVHRGLPEFLSNMIRVFPALRDKINILLEAASE